MNVVPGFPEVVQQFGEAGFGPEWTRLLSQMHEAANSGRSNDTGSLKHCVSYALLDPLRSTLEPPVPKESSKSSRGLNHPLLRQLLLPRKYIDQVNSDPTVLQDFLDGTKRILASDWPAFVYEDGVYDHQALDKGLMRGHLLVRVLRHIFTGPSTALKLSASSQLPKKCNAHLHKIFRVTPPMIAYAAVQARLMISTAESWSSEDGHFDVRKFYNAIVNLFDDSEDPDWVTETLAWWQSSVFGSAGGTSWDTEPTSFTDDFDSDEICLQEQRRLRRAAKHASESRALPSSSADSS